MIKTRASVLIKNKGKVLLIHRIKNNFEYFVLPGGSVEEGENEEEAAIREAKEETGLDVIIEKKLWQFHNDVDNRKHCYFLVTKYSGQLELGSPEIERVTELNKYFLEWHDLQEFSDIKFFPEEIKVKILETFLKNNR